MLGGLRPWPKWPRPRAGPEAVWEEDLLEMNNDNNNNNNNNNNKKEKHVLKEMINEYRGWVNLWIFFLMGF